MHFIFNFYLFSAALVEILRYFYFRRILYAYYIFIKFQINKINYKKLDKENQVLI